MKNIVLAVLLMGAAGTTQAAVDNKTCTIVKELSEATMGARQAGVDIEKALEVADKSGGNLGALSRKIVLDAYSFPAFSTSEYRQKEVREFGLRHYLNCLKQVK